MFLFRQGFGAGERLAICRLNADESHEPVSLAGTGSAGLILLLVIGQQFSQGHIRQAAGFDGLVDVQGAPPAFYEVLAGLLQAGGKLLPGDGGERGVGAVLGQEYLTGWGQWNGMVHRIPPLSGVMDCERAIVCLLW